MTRGLGADYPFELDIQFAGRPIFASGTAYLEQDGSGGCWVASPENIRLSLDHEGEPLSPDQFALVKQIIQNHLNTRDLTEWFQENVLAN